jgi:NTE family protein
VRCTAGNPFPVIAGTSAGALNAAALAGDADDFEQGVAKLVSIWRDFHAEQVYRADSIGVIRTGARWLTMMSIGWIIARWRRLKPRSLLDNAPLASLLERMVRLERIPELIRDGHLRALAVSASSYTTGEHVTFYNAAQEVTAWVRSQRRAVRDHVGLPHLLASSAIPSSFLPQLPSTASGWFDGSMRQAAPISPAIHLGAERILVIGAGRMHEPPGKRQVSTDYPTMAQIAGHALSNIFLDALAVDFERLQRINRTLQLLPAQARQQSSLRPIDVLLIAPSTPGRHCRAAHRCASADHPHPVARRRGERAGQRSARRRTGQLPAVRVGFHPRADGAGRKRHLGPPCRSRWLFRLAATLADRGGCPDGRVAAARRFGADRSGYARDDDSLCRRRARSGHVARIGLAADPQAGGREPGRMARAEPLHSGDEVIPVVEAPLGALGEDALGQLRSDALDHLQLGLVGQIEVGGAAEEGAMARGAGGQQQRQREGSPDRGNHCARACHDAAHEKSRAGCPARLSRLVWLKPDQKLWRMPSAKASKLPP